MSPRWGISVLRLLCPISDWHSHNMSEKSARRMLEECTHTITVTKSIAIWRRENGKRVEVERRDYSYIQLRIAE